ncbi:MAG: hypothetical protein U5K30_01525 [Acidimicrobiales bacterium]|nr:hypothetical protein [Acidimicrobiales bacterium]
MPSPGPSPNMSPIRRHRPQSSSNPGGPEGELVHLVGHGFEDRVERDEDGVDVVADGHRFGVQLLELGHDLVEQLDRPLPRLLGLERDRHLRG